MPLSSIRKQRLATPMKQATMGSHWIGPVRVEYKSWGEAGTHFSFTFTFEAHLQAKAPAGEYPAKYCLETQTILTQLGSFA